MLAQAEGLCATIWMVVPSERQWNTSLHKMIEVRRGAGDRAVPPSFPFSVQAELPMVVGAKPAKADEFRTWCAVGVH